MPRSAAGSEATTRAGTDAISLNVTSPLLTTHTEQQ
jgi:hypothetical protein